MKRIILAGAIALAAITTVEARQPHTLLNVYQGGAWTTYTTMGDQGDPLCGMRVTGQGKVLQIKYVLGKDGLLGQLFKEGWTFPQGATDVPMTVGVDKNPVVNGTAKGYQWKPTIGKVEWKMEGEVAADFLKEFADANKLWLQFESGNESTWYVNMNGSRGASIAFGNCIAALKDLQAKNPPTQPYATPSTQPYAQKKKDNGSI